MKLGERLRSERIRLGLTQQQAADAMGIPTVTYRTYESGRSEPPLSSFARMIDAGFDAHFVAIGQRLAESFDAHVDWALIVDFARVIANWSTTRTRPLDSTEQANYLRLAHSLAVSNGADAAREALQRMFKAA